MERTPTDRGVEIRLDPVLGNSSGCLPNQRGGEESPTCLLPLQSLGWPREAPDPPAPSLGALGTDEPGGRASKGEPPGGTRVTACLLAGCLGNGLFLVGPLVCYSRTHGCSRRASPLASLSSRIPVVPVLLLCPPILFPHQAPAAPCGQFPYAPTQAPVPGMCTARESPAIPAYIQAGTSKDPSPPSALGSAPLSCGLSRTGAQRSTAPTARKALHTPFTH